MDKTEEIIKSIIDDLARLEFIISKRNKLNFYDINIIAESFIANLLNAFWGCKLINLNTSDKNIPSIDLGDDGSSLAVQVTSSKHSRKIQKTLDKFINNEFDKKYKTLKVFIIREKQQSYDHVDTSKLPTFSVKEDILDFNSLIQTLPSIHERLQDIRNVLDRELKKTDVELNALQQDDQSVLEVYRSVFDRPALQDSFCIEGNFVAFEKALTDLISLLNSGEVNGRFLTKSRFKLLNINLREDMNSLYQKIRILRNQYKTYVALGEIKPESNYAKFKSPNTVKAFDFLRQDIINHLNLSLKNNGIKELKGVDNPKHLFSHLQD